MMVLLPFEIHSGSVDSVLIFRIALYANSSFKVMDKGGRKKLANIYCIFITYSSKHHECQAGIKEKKIILQFTRTIEEIKPNCGKNCEM